MLTKLLALSALFYLAADPATAQQPSKSIETELLTLAFNGVVKDLYYLHGKEVREMEASSLSLAGPIYYKGPRALRFYKTEAEALRSLEETENAPKPVLSTFIAEKTNRTLLLFVFADKKDKTPKLKTYGVSDSDLSEADYKIFNFSKQNLYLNFNDKKVAVRAGEDRNVRTPEWKREVQDMNVLFGAKLNGSKEVQRVYSSVWAHRPERRNFIFIFDSGDRNRPLGIYRYYDVPSVAARKNDPSGGDAPEGIDKALE
ncbi:hypothetical protein [Roseibacillus persicicus]|uniref:Uncharacterized protein n=1 Tax=Roseibacillus persicicus TaxID=454148 RepID=A0A918TEY3_9BACT|nr:hypothetical protein [Roseibacillus persicicus]GHC41789.1 hypothetical protein GCM10007100_03300 [Roseibacillus persicicus]